MKEFKIFFFSFVLITFLGCSNQLYKVENVPQNRIFITDSLTAQPSYEELIMPYRKSMEGELDRILTYNPINLDQKGLNTTLGNLVTDLMLQEGNIIYQKKHPNEQINAVLMNRGGLRRTFTPGNLSVRSMYELMPFENEAVVVTMSGTKFYEMIQFLRASDRRHPVAGISFFVDSDDKDFFVNGIPFDESKNYRVLTNDYLQKGGDQMQFFLDPIEVEYLNVKLRQMFIDHFDGMDTVRVDMSPRYLEKKLK